jgi:hypothetical protein
MTHYCAEQASGRHRKSERTVARIFMENLVDQLSHRRHFHTVKG